jgi:asparagine synthase (glutamine-hydrolysing)
MHSADGRFVLIFNGEIYNFLELKSALEQQGHTFRSHSDTEVMLGTFMQQSVERALSGFVGMFAFALWDRQERRLHLARDRAGEKPLYYGWNNGVFLFGSELKALRAYPGWRGELDPTAVTQFLRHNYIPGPRSIYRSVHKLPAGSVLTLDERQLVCRELPTPIPYWRLRSAVERGWAQPFAGSSRAAVEQLTGLVSESISRQMIADVPVGAFLSGGIDSSAVACLMQRQSGRRIKTFSIGFDDAEQDEAPFARAVSQYLGTDHTELYVDARTLVQAVPRLPAIYDEPFADTSHIPTLLLSELAREQVTVCLSGDAGDELFAGYSIYGKTQRLWQIMSKMPRRLRTGVARALRQASSLGLALQGSFGKDPRWFKRCLRLTELLPAVNDRELYRLLVSSCRFPDQWVRGGECERGDGYGVEDWDDLPELWSRMMYYDFIRYLPDDILTKVDRAAMSVGLETRIPLLDHRIVEFAWSLPLSLKQRGGESKWVWRQVLYQTIPKRLVDRPKKGFAPPIDQWMRTDLRAWAEALLAAPRLRESGLFHERNIRQKWAEHLARQRDWGRPLWNVLMLQSWLEAQRVPPPIHFKSKEGDGPSVKKPNGHRFKRPGRMARL